MPSQDPHRLAIFCRPIKLHDGAWGAQADGMSGFDTVEVGDVLDINTRPKGRGERGKSWWGMVTEVILNPKGGRPALRYSSLSDKRFDALYREWEVAHRTAYTASTDQHSDAIMGLVGAGWDLSGINNLTIDERTARFAELQPAG